MAISGKINELILGYNINWKTNIKMGKKNNFNFDHKRPITQWEHILEDYEHDIDEYDLMYLQEILDLHDVS